MVPFIRVGILCKSCRRPVIRVYLIDVRALSNIIHSKNVYSHSTRVDKGKLSLVFLFFIKYGISSIRYTSFTWFKCGSSKAPSGVQDWEVCKTWLKYGLLTEINTMFTWLKYRNTCVGVKSRRRPVSFICLIKVLDFKTKIPSILVYSLSSASKTCNIFRVD